MNSTKKGKSNKATLGSVIFSEEFLQPYKGKIVKDIVAPSNIFLLNCLTK